MEFEFTGERVIPGQVDLNLWNEHIVRYIFAARLARHKRVLDLGCGAGYGCAELSQTAFTVSGIDVDPAALSYARRNFTRPNLHWIAASCTSIPFPDSSFDLVVAFEVIEHLGEWRLLLSEARRVLAPGGQFVVSTPNRLFYAETRDQSGPNPFHAHEFEFEEFRAALGDYFTYASFFLEDHTEGILLRALPSGGVTDVRLEETPPEPVNSNFFIAVCAQTPQTGSPNFVYLPSAANLLKERNDHVRKLVAELQQKDAWLDQSRSEHAVLLELFQNQAAELEKRTRWAQEIDTDLTNATERIGDLQNELLQQRRDIEATVQAYESKVKQLEKENERNATWAVQTEQRLTAEVDDVRRELAQCVRVLHETEATLDERTAWALSLDKQREQLEQQLNRAQASRWIRLGRLFGLGPELQDR